jgi:hypothetical protein
MSSAAHSASTPAIVERNDLIGRFLPFVRSGYINSPARRACEAWQFASSWDRRPAMDRRDLI